MLTQRPVWLGASATKVLSAKAASHMRRTVDACDMLPVPQVSQADRIRKDIDAFTHRVQQHKASFASHALFKYSTGYAAAYVMLDAAAADLAKLSKECNNFKELASVFELTNAVAPVTEAIKELYEQLVAVKDAWDCCTMCAVQFQVGLNDPTAADGTPGSLSVPLMCRLRHKMLLRCLLLTCLVGVAANTLD